MDQEAEKAMKQPAKIRTGLPGFGGIAFGILLLAASVLPTSSAEAVVGPNGCEPYGARSGLTTPSWARGYSNDCAGLSQARVARYVSYSPTYYYSSESRTSYVASSAGQPTGGAAFRVRTTANANSSWSQWYLMPY